MIRTAWFVKEFNGYKGTRMTLADFFTSSEILNLKQNYLDANGRPINSVGSHASGSYGDVDEVEENADIVHLRYRRLKQSILLNNLCFLGSEMMLSQKNCWSLTRYQKIVSFQET